MSGRLRLLALVVAFLSPGAAIASDDVEFIPDLFADFGQGWATNSVLDDGSGKDVVEWGGDISADILWRRGFDGGRYSDFGFGVSLSKLWEDADSGVEPSRLAGRIQADWDVLARDSGFLKRLAIGGRIEWASADFGRLDFGDSTRYTVVAMLTDKVKDECELWNTSVFFEYEDFDDDQNGGDPDYDRSDDGGYKLIAVERSWVLGELDHQDSCYRTGPFFRLIPDGGSNVRIGWAHRWESTRGSLFDAEVDTIYFGGRAPITGSGKVVFDWLMAGAFIDYSQTRDDRSFWFEIGPRWFLPATKVESIRRLDLRLALSGVHRDSTVDAADYDRLAVTVGVGIHLGRVTDSTPITPGSSQVDRRDTPGGSEPVVQSDVDP